MCYSIIHVISLFWKKLGVLNETYSCHNGTIIKVRLVSNSVMNSQDKGE